MGRELTESTSVRKELVDVICGNLRWQDEPDVVVRLMVGFGECDLSGEERCW